MPRGRKAAADTAAEGKGKHPHKPVEKTEKTFVQYAGAEWDVDELKEKVRAAYVAEGHYAASIHDLRLYVKPEASFSKRLLKNPLLSYHVADIIISEWR